MTLKRTAGQIRPFAGVSGTCAPDSTTFTPPPVSSKHDGYLAKFSTSAGPSTFTIGDQLVLGLAGPDTAWRFLDSRYAETIGRVTCAAAMNYTVEFVDVPAAPVAFWGASTYQPSPTAGKGPGTTLAFRVRHAARYVADLALTQGSLTLSSQGRTRAYPSSGRFPLRELQRGRTLIAIVPMEGPPARWTLSLRQLPVKLANPSPNRRYLRAGERLRINYSLDGDTRLSAIVKSSSSRSVRTLTRSLVVSEGTHRLIWDARNDSGSRVPDGYYRISLNTLDFAKHPAKALVPITVDAHGPTMRTLSLPHSPKEHLEISIRDRFSGFSAAALYIDGRLARRLGAKSAHVKYIARQGWRPGRHRIFLRMLDRAGNMSTYRRGFTVNDPLASAVSFARSRSGRVAFAIINEAGRLGGYHLDEGFRSASLVKAMLLVSYLRQLGSRSLTAPDRETLRLMIELSDNGAANEIYRRVGDVGLERVAHLSHMRRFTTLGYWGDNNVTAADQAHFFELLPTLVPRLYRLFAENLLAGVVSWERWGIPAAAPGWHVYFKGGWKPTSGGFSTNQSAYLERRNGRERFVLAILTEGPGQSYGQETIAGITQRLLASRAY